MYCKKCGNEIKNGEKFCCNCGTSIDGATEIKSHRKVRKAIPVLIGICSVGICVGIGSLVQGSTDDLSLLGQIEQKYDIDVSGIKAAGGSAVDNVVLEDYLPRVDSRRFTTVINSEDNAENLIEEMTIDLPNDDGGYNYSVYNYLIEFTVQGVIFPDESDELYYVKQTNMLDDSVVDMNFYIGLPGKTWTLEKKNENATIEMSIAPEFYTVTTPYGTYENCLLKYEHCSCETASWANSHTFTTYAPYGVGKNYSVTYSEDSPETPLTYYTYIPEDSYSDLDSDSVNTAISQDTPDTGMIIADIMDDEATDIWTSGSGTSVLTLAMRLESGDMHVYLFSIHAMEILYSGVIGTTTADEIYIIGDSEYNEGKIVYLSDSELELTIDDEVYVFNIL